ncbi:MAG: plastocyanin/azurin family copper-binding protein [Actinomycetes bacterium]
MSEDTVTTETEGTEAAGTVAVAERPAPPAAVSEAERRRMEHRDRLWLPLLLPVCSILVVAFVVLNISRLLLFSGGDASVWVGTLLTLAILVVATVVAATPRARTSPLWVMGTIVLILVLGVGTLTLGPSSEKEEEGGGGYVEPSGPATSTISVTALSTLKFNAKEYQAAPGVIEIDYVNAGGQHTLVFEDPELAGFELKVGPPDEDAGKVELAAGEYTFYCSIPGHQAAGMQSVLKVSGMAAPTGASGASGATGAMGS